MKDKMIGLFLRVAPRNLLSYVTGKAVHTPLPKPLAVPSMRWFAHRYQLNLDEAEKPLEEYSCIGDLFTRRLKPGLRPVGEGDVVHPVDGLLTQSGYIEDGQLYQLKGWPYSLKDLLQSEEQASVFEGGVYMTYYLCPTDYHRCHSPVSGQITTAHHIPGTLWPVNPWSLEHIAKLFSINERLVIWIQTDKGPVAYVMVGATNVGKITASFDKDLVTNQIHERRGRRKIYSPGLPVQKGDELGVFNMGSTVVVLYPKGFLDGPPAKTHEAVKMGETLVTT